MAKQEQEGNKPEWKEKAGLVGVTCWKNTNKVNGKDVDFYSYTIERGYKDKDNNWANTKSLRRQDLLPLALLLQKAYLRIGDSEEE